MDKKTQKMLLEGLERAGAMNEEYHRKYERELWKEIDTPFTLKELFDTYKKRELDDIRQSLNIGGISSLKKAELADELAKRIPEHFKKLLFLLDDEQYKLIKKIATKQERLKREVVGIDKVEVLRKNSLAYPILQNGQKQLALPEELIDVFLETDGKELQAHVRINTEWVRLTHGMLYYYGTLGSHTLITFIEQFTGKKVETLQFFNVISQAIDYYEQVQWTPEGLVDYRVTNPLDLKKEQEMRHELPYYPFKKNQLLKAGEEDYVDRTPALNDLLEFLKDGYDLTEDELEDIAWEYTDMVQSDSGDLNTMVHYFQEQFEIPSKEYLQIVADKLMYLHNNTRMWVLKGHTPNEVSKLRKPQPSMPGPVPTNSKVVDIRSRQKVGRNDPCPCGSGKKHKKCCGK